ncbi:hypothetical protein [Chryseobacterium chendengshani]|uniref:hypothetical protein n=1 Tax=unclassified Chryseobacterium TaxID=2593645 RepID=UPI001C63B8B2|nr:MULTISPECIES: hypothetical protein [unclassified Chryseobacterium]MBW7676988.1 hypothetical protein [Chryseobacterium sp. LJ756]MBW8522421.1 hypothetical protein [Chryseobacterium sp. LJ668]QYK18060.1 hypothetical protein K0U91_08035 [Chryseobacterium sp. LJ668]
MNKYLFLAVIFTLTFTNGQSISTSNTKDSLSLKKHNSIATNWKIDFAQYPTPNTVLVDLTEDHRYRISYENSVRKDVPTILVVYLSNKKPGKNTFILSKGQSVDIEGYQILLEHHVYPPKNIIYCYDGCVTWKDCVCAYTGTIMSLD